MNEDWILIELDYDDVNVLQKDRGIFLKAHINDGDKTINVTLKFKSQKCCEEEREGD